MKAIAVLILVAAASAVLWLVSRSEDQPLLIDAVVAAAPIAIPHEDMLFAPCPMTPRNVPALKRRLA